MYILLVLGSKGIRNIGELLDVLSYLKKVIYIVKILVKIFFLVY